MNETVKEAARISARFIEEFGHCTEGRLGVQVMVYEKAHPGRGMMVGNLTEHQVRQLLLDIAKNKMTGCVRPDGSIKEDRR